MARRSRLSKKFERRSRNTLILSILGIAAVLFLFLRYGIPLIGESSFLFGRVTSSDKPSQSQTQKDSSYVPSPNLDPLSQATKNQTVKVTGTSLSGLKVALYLNGGKDDEKDVTPDGSFEFEVSLTEGDNIIKAKAIKDKNESDFSDSLTITYKKSDPSLSIDSPHDGDKLNGGSVVTVSGKTDLDNTVVVNDFQAIIDSSGNYSYGLTLKGGDNEIKVVATDLAGNQTQKTIHVSYSQ